MSSSSKEHLNKIADGIKEMSNPEVAQNILEAYTFIWSLLDPDKFGLSCSAEVRDEARHVLGLKKVETNQLNYAKSLGLDENTPEIKTIVDKL